MSMSDPIADMLTRIRNAHMASLDEVKMPYSRMKEEMVRILKREGYIKDYTSEKEKEHQRALRLYLKYSVDEEPAIRGLKRVSRPGIRRYVNCREVPAVLNGLGIAILSTSSGLMTDREARRKKVGGEVLCHVW